MLVMAACRQAAPSPDCATPVPRSPGASRELRFEARSSKSRASHSSSRCRCAARSSFRRAMNAAASVSRRKTAPPPPTSAAMSRPASVSATGARHRHASSIAALNAAKARVRCEIAYFCVRLHLAESLRRRHRPRTSDRNRSRCRRAAAKRDGRRPCLRTAVLRRRAKRDKAPI